MAVPGQITERGDAGAGRLLGVGGNVQSALLRRGNQRPRHPVNLAVTGVAAQVNVCIDQSRDNAVLSARVVTGVGWVVSVANGYFNDAVALPADR